MMLPSDRHSRQGNSERQQQRQLQEEGLVPFYGNL